MEVVYGLKIAVLGKQLRLHSVCHRYKKSSNDWPCRNKLKNTGTTTPTKNAVTWCLKIILIIFKIPTLLTLWDNTSFWTAYQNFDNFTFYLTEPEHAVYVHYRCLHLLQFVHIVLVLGLIQIVYWGYTFWYCLFCLFLLLAPLQPDVVEPSEWFVEELLLSCSFQMRNSQILS